jgi:hypothetical protein
MADVDYINPTSIRPPYKWQPSSGLAGMFYSRDRDRYEEVARMQDERMRHQTQLSLEDLVQGAPVRAAERTAKIADAPVRSRGLEAITRGQELGTEFTEATQPGKIDLTLGEQSLAKGQQGIARAVQVIAQEPAGPDWAARVGTKIKASGLKPNDPSIQILQGILDTGNPQEAQKRALQWLQLQSQTEPRYREAMDTQRERSRSAAEVANIQGGWAVKAAGARAAAKTKNYMQSLIAENDPTKKMALAVQIVADSNADPILKEVANTLIQQLQGLVQSRAQQGAQPNIPGFPQPRPVPLPQPGLPQPGGTPQGGPQGALPPGVRRLP